MGNGDDKYRDTTDPKPTPDSDPQKRASQRLSGEDVSYVGSDLGKFLQYGEPSDVISRSLLRGGASPATMMMPWMKKAINQMVNYSLLSQVMGSGQELSEMLNTGSIEGAFNKTTLSQLLQTLISQVGAKSPGEAAQFGKDFAGQQAGDIGTSVPLTPEEQAQATGNMSAFGPGVAAQYMSPLQALMFADPNFLSAIVGTTTGGNLGQQHLLNNYVQQYLLPTYGAFQPEAAGSMTDVLTILSRLMGRGG